MIESINQYLNVNMFTKYYVLFMDLVKKKTKKK